MPLFSLFSSSITLDIFIIKVWTLFGGNMQFYSCSSQFKTSSRFFASQLYGAKFILDLFMMLVE